MCCGEEGDVVDVFPYLGCQITPAGKSEREINRRVGLTWGVGHFSAGAASVALEVLVPRDKSRGVQEVGAPGLALRL